MKTNATLFSYFDQAVDVINHVLVPLIFALAFIYFLINIYRYFILNGDVPDSQKKGRTFAIYGVVGFAVMLSVWGLVNIIINTFSLQNPARPELPSFGNTDKAAPASKDVLPGKAQAAPGTTFNTTEP